MTFPILAALALACAAAGAAPAAPAGTDTRAAIVASVRARFGDTAIVSVESLAVRGVPADARVRAVPDAGSKVGGPMRFILMDARGHGSPRRLGSADASVRVSIAHVRTAVAVERGQVLSARDLVAATEDVGRVPLQRLPVLEDVVGAAARRDLPPGTLVARNAIDPVPLVKSGDEITTIVRFGGVEARGRAVAAGTAAMGEAVRVVANRRNLRGRVVGAGEVEIQQ